MTTPFRALSAALPLLLAAALPSGGAWAQRTTGDGVFTAEQATAGEAAYQSQCAGCHGIDLLKTDAEAPDLTGGPFRYSWQDKTLAERFEKIRSTMPKPPLPRLDDQMYVDIIAYILSFNGVPAGAERLTADAAKLGAITIDVPQAAGRGGGRRR